MEPAVNQWYWGSKLELGNLNIQGQGTTITLNHYIEDCRWTNRCSRIGTHVEFLIHNLAGHQCCHSSDQCNEIFSNSILEYCKGQQGGELVTSPECLDEQFWSWKGTFTVVPKILIPYDSPCPIRFLNMYICFYVSMYVLALAIHRHASSFWCFFCFQQFPAFRFILEGDALIITRLRKESVGSLMVGSLVVTGLALWFAWR